MERKNFSITSDILGALAGTAVVLPQSMGLGIALFSVMGLDASSGALAGIIGAAVLSIVSGAFGATYGMFSAPNGPVTMLLIGVFSLMASQGASSDEMLATLSAILIFTGVLQISFASVGGTKLVKYIPYPVIVGLISGVGILMVKSQIGVFTKAYQSVDDISIASIPLFVAVLTIVSIIITAKYIKKIPATLVGLFTGILTFQVLNYLYLHGAYGEWVVGVVPGVESLHIGFSLDALEKLNLELIVSSSLALMILATTDCLVTAIVADSQTNLKHNGQKEIMAQGIGQIIVGLLGALGGGGTKGATLVNLQSGGGRYSAVISGVFFILLILFFGFLGVYLPVSVLAGVIIFVGFGMINFDVLSWIRYEHSRTDAVITFIVIGTILFVDLVSAVGVGVIISMLQYIRMQMKIPIVHRQSDATRKHSLVKRTQKEVEILQTKGKQIVILELQGNLFFATAENLLEIVEPFMKKDYFVVLHFQRVGLMDITGAILLLQIASRLQSMGGELLLCHMHKKLGLGKKINTALKNIDKKHALNIRTFINTESALLYGENKLLEKEGIVLRTHNDYISLPHNNFCKSIPKELVAIIESLAQEKHYTKGEVVFEQEEFGDSLFMVLQGEVDIRLYSSKKSYTNLARYGAGTYFGEIAFLNPGKRVASAVVNYDTILLEFPHDAIVHLQTEQKAQLASVLLFELGSTLGNELRYSAQEIQRLEKT